MTARTESTRPAVDPQGSERSERVGALALAYLEGRPIHVPLGPGDTRVQGFAGDPRPVPIPADARPFALSDLRALIARCEAAEARESEQAILCERAQRRLAEAQADAERLAKALDYLLSSVNNWLKSSDDADTQQRADLVMDLAVSASEARPALAAHREGGGK